MFVLPYSEPESANRNADRMELLLNIGKKHGCWKPRELALGKCNRDEYSSDLSIVLPPLKNCPQHDGKRQALMESSGSRLRFQPLHDPLALFADFSNERLKLFLQNTSNPIAGQAG